MFPSRRGYRIVASVHVTPLDSTAIPSVHATGTGTGARSDRIGTSSDSTGTRARVCRGVGEVYEPVFNTPLVFPPSSTPTESHDYPQHHPHSPTDSLVELKEIIDKAVGILTAMGPLTNTVLLSTSPTLPHHKADSTSLNPHPNTSTSPSPGAGAECSPCLDSAEAVGVSVHRLLLLLSSSTDHHHNNNNITATTTATTDVTLSHANGLSSRPGFAQRQHMMAVAHYGFEQALLHVLARCAGE